MPSTNTEQSPPVGLLVLVTTASTRISVSVTPGAETCTFVLRAAGLTDEGVVTPFGIVDADLLFDPLLPHAAPTNRTVTTTTRIRARMLPPGRPSNFRRPEVKD